MAFYGYIRVSTQDQNSARQLIDTGYNYKKIFYDHISGKNRHRPGLNELLSSVKKGDRVVVHELSRLGRNLRDILAIVDELGQKGVILEILHERLNLGSNSDPFSDLYLAIMGGVAQFERGQLLLRQKEGIAIAKQKGLYKGGKKGRHKIDPRIKEKAKELRKLGYTYQAIADELNTNRCSVHNWVNAPNIS